MRWIGADAVDRALDYRALIEALRAGHRQGIDAVDRLLLAQPSRSGVADLFLIWPAWQRGEALGAAAARCRRRPYHRLPYSARGAPPRGVGLRHLWERRGEAV